MAIICRKICYKYLKCIITIVVFAFFTQIIIALIFFPPVKDMLEGQITRTHEITGRSARKSNVAYEDDEDLLHKNKKLEKHTSYLRLKELDFTPACEINNREAISAIHRAKSQQCKQQIVNKTCLIQNGVFYPTALPNYCPDKTTSYGKQLGCYQDEKKMRLLSSFYGNYVNTNSPSACLDLCVQAGLPYAGVQYASECFCGDTEPPRSARLDAELCDMPCPADASKNCGGYFTMNVYETGLLKFKPQIPKTSNDMADSKKPVRIVFLLSLNGRALRQVYRLINSLYRTEHYFYIHIDKRQDYLYRELSELEQRFSNIKLAADRFSTIWGGASLLQMLLAAMRHFPVLGWQWDYVINLSESDFLIKSLESLESFLSVNKGLNFVKSHGREVQRFIKKQGLDKTFVECDTHMWRIGERKLPKGMIVDGGSDWIALSPGFVSYVTGARDQLLTGLDRIFKHTLLPAESFFHTALRNSKFCNTYVDNNLHVTNWKRKLGCKCQYKHVVDWCGCSPNDFRIEDWPRIQNTRDKQLFFARKFEPVINQEIITRVERSIGYSDHSVLPNIDSYWQSIYDSNDLPSSSDDLLLTHANSVGRLNAKTLLQQNCRVLPGEVLQLNIYNEGDHYKGNLILQKVEINNNLEVLIEIWYKPNYKRDSRKENYLSDSIKLFRVSSEYDQKEMTFRNFADILGPLSEPVLLLEVSPLGGSRAENLTAVWQDPAGAVAAVSHVMLDEVNNTQVLKADLKMPLLPGIWKVTLSKREHPIVQTTFLITPLEYFSGKEITQREADIIHSGSQNSYKKYPDLQLDFLPNQEESLILEKNSQSNVKRVEQDLTDWIDSLTHSVYNIVSVCMLQSPDTVVGVTSCAPYKFTDCSLSRWSSLSPDPKGRIGILNKSTGRLERI